MRPRERLIIVVDAAPGAGRDATTVRAEERLSE